MKLVIACGVILLCFMVFFVGMLLPDTTEGTILSYIANKASDSKRNAVMNSIEMQAAEIEIEGLQIQLEQARAEIKAQEQMCALTDKGSAIGAVIRAAWPW
ncbi:MAG: hypothetical protein R3F54_28775 [Alphaproteobacteria bacterium]